MENINIGVVNLVISNKLKDSYFNNNLIGESKAIAFDFFDVMKKSPLLQLEFKVFNNIENKHIESDLAATRYIDNNIKLFEVYTIEEIEREHEKLIPLIEADLFNLLPENYSHKYNLYCAIDNLIKESLIDYDKVDVDDIHESFTVVLNHIKTPKNLITENVDIKDEINDDIIEIAINKFNEKYFSLNEGDRNLFLQLIKSTDNEKLELLETYKTESIALLENVNNTNSKDGIAKAIQKINEMSYKKDSVDDDIISLYELKTGLL